MHTENINFNRIFLVGFAFVGILLIQCNRSPGRMQQLHEATVYLNHHDSVEYVGMHVCRECHPTHYNSYIRTGMGQSFDTASPAKSAAVIGPDSILYDAYTDFYFRPYWNGNLLMLEEYRNKDGKRIHERIEKIDYVVGSGQHTNSHIHLSGQYAYQAPLTYYTQDQRFDLPPGFEEGGNERFSRKIGLECMTCHNGYPEMVLGSENKYTFIPDGIDCERCHGPGEIHVMLKRKGFIVDTSKKIDYSIVNPAKLSKDRQTDLCARCHLQGTMVLRQGKSFFDFKPGQELDSVMDIFMPWFEGGKEDFIMASHYERMVQSTCYLKSKGAFTCTECHNPHVSRKETPQNRFNRICFECHTDPEQGCKADLVVRKEAGNNCVLCHMRDGETRDIPHVRTHDHKISIPPTPDQLKTERKFKGLISINNPKTDPLQTARGYLLEYESFHPDPAYLDSASWYLNKVPAKGSDISFNTLVNYYFLKQDFDAIRELVTGKGIRFVLDSLLTEIEYSNYDAWTAYRIGQSYENTGNFLLTGYFYQKATELAPFVLEFQNHYGSQLINTGELKKAIRVFEFILNEDPAFAKAYVNLGYIHVRQNRLDKGKSLYTKALSLDPDNHQALLNFAAVYYLEGNNKAAKKLLKRLLALDPANKQARKLKLQLSVEGQENLNP